MSFAERLARLMDEKGVSPVRLAADMEAFGLGVTQHAVYGWMTGRVQPRFDYVPIIAKALGVDPNVLHGWDGAATESVATGTEG